MKLQVTKVLTVVLLLLNVGAKAKGEVLDAVTSATPVKIAVEVNADKQLVYGITYEEEPIIQQAPLGLKVDHRSLGKDVKILKKEKEPNNTLVFHVEQSDGKLFYLETRIFNDGIALRYRIPTEEPICIYGEETSFVFPSKTKSWYASGPFQYGWLQQYQERETDCIEGELLAPPATFQLPNGTYAAVTEANLFNFHGAVLFGTAPNKIQFGYVENKGHIETGTITGIPASKYWHEAVRNVPWIVSPKANSKEVVTPWRVLMLSKNLNGLVNNKIIAQVADRPDSTLFPDGAKTDWIKPGRASFTWLVEGNDRLSVANHKRYVDGCAELGIESIVVDDGWELWQKTEKEANGRSKWDMLKELVDYAKAKNVAVWVWRPSSPRYGNKEDIGLIDAAERTNFMKKCAEVGVKGLKIDFFHTENLFTVNLMEEILKDAAKEKLMVIFHGVNKPTGDSYTYPNLLAKEAVRGLECVGGEDSWAPGPSWPFHNTVLPFTRWLVGPADYTPLNFRRFCHPSVTFGFQLSSIYMFTSPMLIFAADVEDMLSCPARSFIENVPVTWDETVVLPESEIGRLATLARRKENVWYLTVINGDTEQLFDAKLDFLPEGKYQMEIVSDAPGNRKQLEVKTRKIRAGQRLKQELLSGGGFVARITKL